MKEILVNGSPNANGCTYTALKIIARRLEQNEVEAKIFQTGKKPLSGCLGCGYCRRAGKCVHDDVVNEVALEMDTADGLIIGSAVHYASATGSATSFMDRLFFSSPNKRFRMKFGAAVVSCRRGGATAAFDQLNKYFTISQMPIASGRYWNNGFGREKGEISADEEGLQNARVVARNMVFLMRSIALGRERYGLPEQEETAFTHFVR
jgi:multimeric flavodoxin WrbA